MSVFGANPQENETFRRYVEPVTGNLTRWESFMLATQELEDEQNDIHTPTVEGLDGPLLEYTSVGMLELGEIIHTGHESVIYKTINRPELLVKYQVNCDEIRDGAKPIHPLVYDYWMMREASMFEIAPEPIFLSPAALLVDVYGPVVNRKFPFTMSSADFLECLANEGSVRYMVMRKSEGASLHDYRKQFRHHVVPIANASEITIRIIQALEQLHEDAGIVHGDIHVGNILIEQVDNSTDIRVVLIDFGRARRVDRSLTNDRVNPVGKWMHQLCSPWQIDGREWARRDDIYKTIHLFSTIINPGEYSVREEIFLLLCSPDVAVGVKRDAYMFVMAPPVMIDEKLYGSKFHPIMYATRNRPERMVPLSNELDEIQHKVTAQLDDINADIPYRELVDHFRSVINLVS